MGGVERDLISGVIDDTSWARRAGTPAWARRARTAGNGGGAARRTARAGRAPGRDEGGRTPRGQGADVTVGARTDGRPGGRTRGRRFFRDGRRGFPYAAAGGEGGTTHLSEHQVQRPRSSNSAFPVVEILRWVCAGGGRETWDERGDGRTDGGKGRGKARNGREGRF